MIKEEDYYTRDLSYSSSSGAGTGGSDSGDNSSGLDKVFHG